MRKICWLSHCHLIYETSNLRVFQNKRKLMSSDNNETKITIKSTLTNEVEN